MGELEVEKAETRLASRKAHQILEQETQRARGESHGVGSVKDEEPIEGGVVEGDVGGETNPVCFEEGRKGENEFVVREGR